MDILSFDNLVTIRNEENRDGPYIDPKGHRYGYRGDNLFSSNLCNGGAQPDVIVIADTHPYKDGHFVAFACDIYFAFEYPDEKPSTYADTYGRNG